LHLLPSDVTDEINTIHLQISAAADALPPAEVRQVPVVVEAPDMEGSFDFAGGGRTSNRAHNLDLTLRKVSSLALVIATMSASVLLTAMSHNQLRT
jgi:hypothetical protein